MKSNASATATSSHRMCTLIPGSFIARPENRTLGVLDHDAFDDVRYVLAAIGHCFEQLVDRAQLDQLANVGLLSKELGDRRAHDVIGLRLESVDVGAYGENALCMVHVVEHRNAFAHLR